MHETNRRLMAKCDVQLCLSRKRIEEKLDFLHRGDDGLASFHTAGSASQAAFDIIRVKLCDTHADSVALSRDLDRLAEHLHGLDLLFDAQHRQFDCVANLDLAGQHGSRHHCALAFNLEAVVNRVQKMLPF